VFLLSTVVKNVLAYCTTSPSWLLAEYRPSMGITAPPSWLLAEYRPSMGIKKATVFAVAF